MKGHVCDNKPCYVHIFTGESYVDSVYITLCSGREAWIGPCSVSLETDHAIRPHKAFYVLNAAK